MARTLVALTLPGAASLGSFEGGVVSALIVAAQAANRELIIDAIAGASAGAITGLLAARALTSGLDPVALQWGTWVETASLQRLRGGGLHSPLSADALRAAVAELLDQNGEHRRAGVSPQDSPVRLRMILCCLQGLRYDLADVTHDHSLPATTWRDWSDFTFTPFPDGSCPADVFDQFVTPSHASAVEVAMASAASALAFPPCLLNRRLRTQDCEAITANRVSVPADGWLWYTDGGTVNNEPLSHAVRLSKILDRSGGQAENIRARRLHLLVQTELAAPTADSHGTGTFLWRDHRRRPSWSDTLVQTGRILASQTVYEDLRALLRDQTRVGWQQQLCQALDGTLTDEQRQRLIALHRAIDEDRRHARQLRGTEPKVTEDHPLLDDGQLVIQIIEAVSDVRGRHPADVAIICPDQPTPIQRNVGRLRGSGLGHFAGFIDRADRITDFLAGYDQAGTWMTAAGSLLDGLSHESAAAARAAVSKRRPHLGGVQARAPRSMARRVALARLGAKAAVVVTAEKIFGMRPRQTPSPDVVLRCPGNPDCDS